MEKEGEVVESFRKAESFRRSCRSRSDDSISYTAYRNQYIYTHVIHFLRIFSDACTRQLIIIYLQRYILNTNRI